MKKELAAIVISAQKFIDLLFHKSSALICDGEYYFVDRYEDFDGNEVIGFYRAGLDVNDPDIVAYTLPFDMSEPVMYSPKNKCFYVDKKYGIEPMILFVTLDYEEYERREHGSERQQE